MINDVPRKTSGRPIYQTAAPLLCILIVGTAVRLLYMKAQTFYIDEAFNFMLGRHSLAQIVAGSASESNPPLPAIIAHFWELCGTNILWLRTLPLLFSAGALVLTYFAAVSLIGRRAGFFAAMLMAISPYQLLFSHIYRYPAQAIFLGALALFFFVKLVFDEKRIFTWPFAFVCALSLYTHYFFVFLVFFFNVYFLVRSYQMKNAKVVAWIISQAAVFACFAPWLFFSGLQTTRELKYVGVPKMAEHLKAFPFKGTVNVAQSYLTGYYPFGARIWFISVVLLLFVFLFSICVSHAPKKEGYYLSLAGLITCIFPPYLLMFFFGLRINPIFYFCMFSPLFYIFIASSIFCGAPARLRLASCGLLFIILFFSLKFYFINVRPERDNATAIRHILSNRRDNDIVLLNPTYQESLFNYYAPGKFNIFGIPDKFNILRYNFNNAAQVSESRLRELDKSLKRDGRIWAFFGFGVKTKPDQAAATIAHLEKNYNKTFEMDFAPMSFARESGKLYLFERKPTTDGAVK